MGITFQNGRKREIQRNKASMVESIILWHQKRRYFQLREPPWARVCMAPSTSTKTDAAPWALLAGLEILFHASNQEHPLLFLCSPDRCRLAKLYLSASVFSEPILSS